MLIPDDVSAQLHAVSGQRKSVAGNSWRAASAGSESGPIETSGEIPGAGLVLEMGFACAKAARSVMIAVARKESMLVVDLVSRLLLRAACSY